jgi:DNA modification methylase
MPTLRNLIEIPVELKEIEIAKINLGERRRTDYGNTKVLQLSIQQRGLIGPIAVMQYETPYNNFEYFLIAGGRRIRACRALGMETMQARVYPYGLNAYEIRAIELEENIHRKDLNDAERIKSIKDIHDLYVSIYGTKTSTTPGAPGHSMRDTAQMLGVDVSTVSRDYELATLLEEIPELAKLKNKSDIKRVADTAKRTVHRENALKQIGVEVSQDIDLSLMEKAFVVGDFFEKQVALTKGSFDLAEIDIDYPMDVEDNILQDSIGSDKKRNVYHGLTKPEYETLMPKTLQVCYDLLQENGWALVWFGFEYYDRLRKWAEAAGFKPSWYFGKWYKKVSHTQTPFFTLGHSMEYFLYLKKGSPRIVKPHADVFEMSPTSSSMKSHPYEKPVELYVDLLETFIDSGSRVVCPFAGGGTFLRAAFAHDCFAVGFDKSDVYHDEYIVKVRGDYALGKKKE